MLLLRKSTENDKRSMRKGKEDTKEACERRTKRGKEKGKEGTLFALLSADPSHPTSVCNQQFTKGCVRTRDPIGVL